MRYSVGETGPPLACESYDVVDGIRPEMPAPKDCDVRVQYKLLFITGLTKHIYGKSIITDHSYVYSGNMAVNHT